ncbi:MAG TPA: A/G-specific adenine glycosylase, partial [Acinetobacter nosocomialis]|nr:A/G-specific adenine glycosylase [Acinetobacter nosocomialis]
LENEHERLKLSQQFKLQPQAQTFQISHSFTHFTWLLNAHVFHVEPDQKEHLAIELEGQWLSPEQAVAKGVPTAMKKLISTSRS